jgi:hypothetical protein
VIEDLLFPHIYKDLLYLFKRRFKEEDSTHTRKLKEFSTICPAHLGIEQKFWLVPLIDDVNRIPITPYQKAIEILQQLPNYKTPSRKIKCLVETAKAIVSCVDNHWKGKSEAKNVVVGGDELLPIFTYVVIKASVPYLFTESSFVETFITESAAKEQGGYLVATFQMSVHFIAQLNKNQLEESAKQIFEKASMQENQKAIEQKTQMKKATSITLIQLESSLDLAFDSEKIDSKETVDLEDSDDFIPKQPVKNNIESPTSPLVDLISFD